MQLFLVPSDQTLRLGITASRKVGNAVVRHRLKRNVREVYRRSRWRHELRGDLVVNLYREAAEMGFHEVEQALAVAVASLRNPRRRSRRQKNQNSRNGQKGRSGPNHPAATDARRPPGAATEASE